MRRARLHDSSDSPEVTPPVRQTVMRHFDVAVICDDDSRTVVLVHAKSPAAAIRTAVYSIEDGRNGIDPERVVSMSVFGRNYK
jgi:hypothetical protein